MIHSVEIRNFRCFRSLSVGDCRRFNVIVGDNGAGKTALLEAIFLALGSSPTLALRYRQQRGLVGQFGGQLHVIEEAMWRDLFYKGEWDSPINVELSGDGAENRTVTVSRGSNTELVIPFEETTRPSEGRTVGMTFRWKNSSGRDTIFTPKVSQGGAGY